MKEQFIRTAMVLGDDALDRLHRSHVAVFGLGGVGGYIAEALARAGVGSLLLIDGDEIAPSNLNRQLFATADTVGMRKTDAARERIRLVAPECRVETSDLFYLPETADQIPFEGLSYVADAIDTVSAKLEIIARAKTAGVPVISSMGTGNKLHPELFEITDISKTSVCPLARVMRRELKNRGITRVKVLYSKEEPRPSPLLPEGESSRRSIPASISFVPATAGLLIAGEIVRDIAGID